MLEIHHFTYGVITPIFAYVMSFIGSLLGLLCATKARTNERRRTAWLISAAIAIGGTGIWVMHFIAMLGFSISKDTVRYNIPLTLLSAVTAIVVVGCGLFIVSGSEIRLPALLIGGAITGGGVAAMHYTGMAAINTHAAIHYSPRIVALSVLIAIVAATVALWFTLRVNGIIFTVGAAMIMGVAVCGMHYTAMAAMSAERSPGHDTGPTGGASVMGVITPLILVVSIVTMSLLLELTMTYDEDDPRRARITAPRQRPGHARASHAHPR